MSIRPARPAQSRTVVLNTRAYAWDTAWGLDPAAILEILKFIQKLAWQRSARTALAGLEVEDLVQEGVAGALKAAARYNPEAGAFITYAKFWIEAAMGEALNRPLVRTPPGAAFAQVRSLDAPGNPGEDADGPVRQDWQRDEAPGPHDLSTAEEDRVRLHRALPRLAPRDREVLARHLGLDGRDPQSLQAIALDLGLTRQRAAQLFDRARHDLRRELGQRTA